MANYSNISEKIGETRNEVILENPVNLNCSLAIGSECDKCAECDKCVDKLASHSISHVSDSELLAILLCCGFSDRSAVDDSRKLINTFDDIHGLDYASAKEISMVEGFCMHKAAIIKAAMELGKRVSSTLSKRKYQVIEKSWDVANIFMPQMKSLRKEIFKTAILDTKNKIIKTITISEGGLAAAIVSPREVFSPAVREMAHGVILLHNHPSGDPAPSKDDINLTRRLKEAGKLISVEVVDHIIIGDNKYYSFVDEDML
ncbi:UPF0758 family protein [hydrothermal vent metagenome]|uniref:UPF0758 family protein n=1 Tax=hydrothermal vent metagenome TaxID=652676 RepID=A0A3B1CL17_9ZZZZ